MGARSLFGKYKERHSHGSTQVEPQQQQQEQQQQQQQDRQLSWWLFLTMISLKGGRRRE